MNFTLIVCTYMRPESLQKLLNSVKLQTLYPNEILIIDGSRNLETKSMLDANAYKNLKYFLVEEKDRGLTRQRNFGINALHATAEIVFFLDDDTVLESSYFEKIIETFIQFPNALGVGGYITNEVVWEKTPENYKPSDAEFYYDGFKRTDGSRFIIRKKLGLDTDAAPGFLPEFSHGRSTSFLPPSKNTYEVEHLIGCTCAFRKSVFETFKFSVFFDGYGLYEDADFTLRLSKVGKLYVNTAAELEHHHDALGRPNKYNYGKMVVRNGWYIRRVKYPKPSLNAKFKWHAITLLLTFIRFSNTFTTAKKQEAFTESLGRTAAWFGLFFNKPRI